MSVSPQEAALPAEPSGAGRAWLPSSTGFSPDRPPTLEERREAWLRQARGVFDMTYRARGAAAAASRVMPIVGALLLLAGAGFLAGFHGMPPSTQRGLVIALHVIAGLLLLLSQLAGPSLMASDAVAEVTAKSSQAWASSPLPTSAWIAGKVAYYAMGQGMATLRILPFVGASAMLGGVRLREAAVIAGLGLLWTIVTGMAVAAAALEPRQHLAARLAARRGGLGGMLGQANPALRGSATPPAAALAVVQVAVGIAGVFIAMPFAFGGFTMSSVPVPVALMLTAFCAISPIGAGGSAFVPGLGVDVAGSIIPMWLVSAGLALVWAPAVLAAARLKWRPPDSSLGLGVRPASAVALAASVAVILAIVRRDPDSAAVAALAAPLLAAFVTGLAAGATRLPDLAASAPRARDRILGLDRRTAGAHALIVLGLVTIAAMVVMPPGLFRHVPSAIGMLLLAAACAPVAILAGVTGREGRRSVAQLEAGIPDRVLRPGSIALLAFVLASLLPLGAAVLAGFGIATLPDLLRLASLLSPVHSLIGLGRDILGLPLPTSPNAAGTAAILAGIAAQFVVAALVAWLSRRDPALDDIPAAPPPPD